MHRLLLALLLTTLITGCGGDTGRIGGPRTFAEFNRERSEKFLAENRSKEGVKETPTGLQYKVLQEGDGPRPKSTDLVSIRFTGKTALGEEFRPGRNTRTIAVNGTARGWERALHEAVNQMKVGGKWRLFIPPDMAYAQGSAPPGVPPSSVLILDLELVSIVTAANPAGGPANPPGGGNPFGGGS